MLGSEFIAANMNLIGEAREANILSAILDYNIPDFLNQLKEVTITQGINTLTYLVMPDYLSIGDNSDYCRMPMTPITAQKIADQYNCTLPTKKMVDQIWKTSTNKLMPMPWGPPYNSEMEATFRFKIHNETINKQLFNKDLFALTSGHKKDIIINNSLLSHPQNVCIYGWIYTNGNSIQTVNAYSHDKHYADYSHGTRLVSQNCTLNNKDMKIQDILTDKDLYSLISDEPLKFLRY